jgi:hypothetical protein
MECRFMATWADPVPEEARMSKAAPNKAYLAGMALLLSAATGCNWLIPGAVLMGPPTKKVEAEFSRLEGKRVAVLVWAPPAILTNYPYARYDIAKYAGDALESQIRGVTTVSARRVEDYVSKHPEGTVDPEMVGERFNAEVVVYLELLRYQMRSAESPHLYRGDIQASVVVYEMQAADGRPKRYELSAVGARHPEGAPVSIYNTTEQKLRKETSEIFAEKLAQKFKAHRVEL